MSAHGLAVFSDTARVGTIGFDSLDEQFSFLYDAGWRDGKNTWPLSPWFPLAGSAPSSSTVRRFLENLLPEGRALDVVASTHRVAKNNIFGLVREIGRETSGALSFLPVDDSPEQQQTTRREISSRELQERIRQRNAVPFSVWDGRVRMSIAGYQDKLSVFVEDGRMFLVEGALASTHILKPEPATERLPHLVANEHFCMALARRIGLPAADVSIERLPDAVLVIKRFDRERAGDGVRRLHIVDACQALDLPVSYKYERNFGSGSDVRHIRDGVSFERLFTVANFASRKALTTQVLTRWALFQYLIGNSDAHGKNVSFFCGPAGIEAAPFYDLVSVVAYEGLSHEMAMAYGDEFELPDVTPFAWADFANRCRLGRGFLAREMVRLARAAAGEAKLQADDPVYVDDERDAVRRVAALVSQQSARLLAASKPMTEVDANLL